ncbi:hypothetical protein [Polaromonas sp. JS666]|uniref:hypothetical protein n=1 Tax=Polaromonas sp. (strain JS666 / ATCC BAA-500) TaxID=296591 RepID=UPI0012ECC246|nr:hypothetical protein [Polaromonas sp. JS666]
MSKKKPPCSGFFQLAEEDYFFAASAAEAAPAAAEAAPAAASAAPAAAEAASAAGAAAGAGAATGAGAGAGASSFLPQAARATAATIAAKTSDLFIFTILDEFRKQFPETVKGKPNLNSGYVFDRGKDSSSFYPAINYMSVIASLKTLSRQNAAWNPAGDP